jgi:hypothetical protein
MWERGQWGLGRFFLKRARGQGGAKGYKALCLLRRRRKG